MKKLLLVAALIAALVFPSIVSAATPGSCTETATRDSAGTSIKIKLACTANSGDGTFPTITISTASLTLIKDIYYLYGVKAYPTSGGTAPDAADVTVNMEGQDLLGGKGVNLIHATATYDTAPYSSFSTSYRYPLITNTLTVGIANQGTNSANLTLELIFVR